MTHHDSNRSTAGWVLMEALVSMVVLSVAVVALNRGFAEAVLTRSIARDYTQARFFLEQVVGELEMKPVHVDGTSGKGGFGKDHPRFSYSWSVKRVDVARPELPVALPPQLLSVVEAFEPPIEYLGQIAVRVNWTRSGQSFSSELETTIAPGALYIPEEDDLEPPA